MQKKTLASKGYNEVKGSALRMLSRRAMSEAELRQKLILLGADQAIVQTVLQYLREQGYIDDAKYAESFIHYSAGRKYYGIYRIQSELARKGLDRDLIDEAMQEYNDEDEQYESCRLLLNKLLRRWSLESLFSESFLYEETGQEEIRRAKQKLYRNASAKGFPAHIIIRALDDLSEPDDVE